MVDYTFYIERKKMEINIFLKEEVNKLLKKNDKIKNFDKYFTYALFSYSKKIRPLLSLLIYDLLEGQESNIFYPISAIELIHTYSLIHDDLPSLDNSSMRRNQPSFHKKFGEASAILFGNTLLVLAFEFLSKVKIKNQRYIINQFCKMIGLEGMILGQFLDLISLNIISFPNLKKDIKDPQYIAINKTARLIQLSCIVPPLFLNFDRNIVKKFRQLGLLLGVSFQILDDIQDKNESKTLNYFHFYGEKKCLKILKNIFFKIEYILGSFKKDQFLLTFLKKNFSL